MSVARCISSHMMTGLLTWRNPHGSEERWVGHTGQSIENPWKHCGKVISTEIGLCILATTSAVETVVYAILVLPSLLLYPATDKPYKFIAKLLQSSSFTVIWGLADAVVYNPFYMNVMTRESFARYWVNLMFSTLVALYRLEDRLYIADYQQRNPGAVNNDLLRPIIKSGQTTQQLIDDGANLIAHVVLKDASKKTIDLFQEMDPSIFMFILTKAIYIYVAGSKKEEDIPDFFKSATKNLILTLRRELQDKEVLKKLESLTQDPEKFEDESLLDQTDIKDVFNRLRNIASGELQNSMFATRCWSVASQNILKRVEIN